MQSATPVDAMSAFLEGLRLLFRCHMAVALLQRNPDEVLPLCSTPSIQLTHTPVWRWRLPRAPIDGTGAVQRLPRQQLPSLVTAGLPFIPEYVVYVDCSALGKLSEGGFVLLWDEKCPSHQGLADAISLGDAGEHRWIRPVYAQLLDASQWEAQKADSVARFHHVFDTVPHGIVVLSVKSAEAQINKAAAKLFCLPSESVPAEVLAKAMRDTRSLCDNATELEQTYATLQNDLDAQIVVNWHLQDRVWRADTHPILQSGHKGRVWLFQDITAQTKLERVLRMEANHDSLTGLFNRRAFFDRAQMAFESADEEQELALVMFDIDHFKRVNDRYGHTVGDQVINGVAGRAQSVLRDGDMLARYGGEEFIILLKTNRRLAAYEVAERLRTTVCAHPMQAKEFEVPVSVSVGVAFLRVGPDTLQQLIARADANLYQAKREGRNRTVCEDY